jgi:hypothetical protein
MTLLLLRLLLATLEDVTSPENESGEDVAWYWERSIHGLIYLHLLCYHVFVVEGQDLSDIRLDEDGGVLLRAGPSSLVGDLGSCLQEYQPSATPWEGHH